MAWKQFCPDIPTIQRERFQIVCLSISGVAAPESIIERSDWCGSPTTIDLSLNLLGLGILILPTIHPPTLFELKCNTLSDSNQDICGAKLCERSWLTIGQVSIQGTNVHGAPRAWGFESGGTLVRDRGGVDRLVFW